MPLSIVFTTGAKMNNSERAPIEYSDLVDIRFADLDFYGHVSSKHYIDLVATARLRFMHKKMQMRIEEVTARGVGFFLIKSTIHYKRPIHGLQRVYCSSHVADLRDGKVLVIPFTLESEDRTRIYSDGILEFALIDMATKKMTTASDWILDLFFEGTADS